MEFQAVRCPTDEAVVMEIATGLARGRCPQCKRRVWAASNGSRIEVVQVDAPLRRVAQSSQTQK